MIWYFHAFLAKIDQKPSAIICTPMWIHPEQYFCISQCFFHTRCLGNVVRQIVTELHIQWKFRAEWAVLPSYSLVAAIRDDESAKVTSLLDRIFAWINQDISILHVHPGEFMKNLSPAPLWKNSIIYRKYLFSETLAYENLTTLTANITRVVIHSRRKSTSNEESADRFGDGIPNWLRSLRFISTTDHSSSTLRVIFLLWNPCSYLNFLCIFHEKRLQPCAIYVSP